MIVNPMAWTTASALEKAKWEERIGTQIALMSTSHQLIELTLLKILNDPRPIKEEEEAHIEVKAPKDPNQGGVQLKSRSTWRTLMSY